MNIGDIVKQYRKSNSYTMQEFANLCHLSKAYISMLESGKRPSSGKTIVPSLKTYSQIAAAMHITLNELIEMLDDNTKISLKDSDEKFFVSESEQEFLYLCRELNYDGQNKLMEYAHDLVASGRYKR